MSSNGKHIKTEHGKVVEYPLEVAGDNAPTRIIPTFSNIPPVEDLLVQLEVCYGDIKKLLESFEIPRMFHRAALYKIDKLLEDTPDAKQRWDVMIDRYNRASLTMVQRHALDELSQIAQNDQSEIPPGARMTFLKWAVMAGTIYTAKNQIESTQSSGNSVLDELTKELDASTTQEES